MITQRAYKFRFYPTDEQAAQLAKEFGAARFVWNRALDIRTKAWEERQERHNYVSLGRMVTEWKRDELPWLAESTADCATQALIDQDKAFEGFFRRVKAGGKPGYPKFKSKYGKQAVRYKLDQRHIDTIYAPGELLRLPKLGAVNVRWSRVPDGTPKMATVSKTKTGKYFVSFSCEVDIQPLPATGKSIGVDLGVKDVIVTSDGWKSGNPKHYNRLKRHLKRQQRRLSRMQKGSHRRAKQKIRLAKIHEKITNCRADFLHKTTTELVRRANVIAIEDLHVKGMVKNHCLAGSVADASMSEIRRQIEYKSAWYGRQVRVIDRWAPSSKTCSECGVIKQGMTLAVRTWTCPDCGTKHDRDINAAKNILSFSTARYAGIDARGVGKNLSVSESLPGTHEETRTKPEKFPDADRQERAA